MCPQNDIVFFSLLNKIKCLRWWVSNSHLSKVQVESKSFFFKSFSKRNFLFSRSFILAYLRLHQHLNQLSLFRQFWIGFDSP